MDDETFEILSTPFDPPPLREWWLSEFRSYCAADEQPIVVEAPGRFHDCMVLRFPSKYACGWLWASVHPVDAVQAALDAGALTKETAEFDLWRSRLMAHRERAAMTPRQRVMHELHNDHQDILSAIDDSDPHNPTIGLRNWPSSWLAIQRGADGYRMVIDGSQYEQAGESGELGPVFQHFDRISHQLYKE